MPEEENQGRQGGDPNNKGHLTRVGILGLAQLKIREITHCNITMTIDDETQTTRFHSGLADLDYETKTKRKSNGVNKKMKLTFKELISIEVIEIDRFTVFIQFCHLRNRYNFPYLFLFCLGHGFKRQCEAKISFYYILIYIAKINILKHCVK